MFVRSLAIFGAAAVFVAANAADAEAFFGHGRHGGYKTCYKKVSTPPVYKTVMRRVMVRPSTCSSYRTPPTYGTVEQDVVVQPARQVVHSKPPVYGRVEETRMVRRARTRWTRGGCHGEYKCAVTKPAKYRTRTKRVMLEPRQSYVVTHPAIKETVQQQVVLDPGEVKQVCEPAVYKTVPQQVMVSPGRSYWMPVAHSGHRHTRHAEPVVQQPVQYAPAPNYGAQYRAPLK